MTNNGKLSRRRVLTLGVLGASAAATGTAWAGRNPSGSPPPVRFAELRPSEFRARLKARPIAYLPLGTIEWHGEHLPLGSDAIQSEGLMIECARRLGGIVMPPVHLGPDGVTPAEDGSYLVGMDRSRFTQPARQLDGSCYWISEGLFSVLVDAVLAQIKRAGFRAVFADGHGPSRASWAANLKERETRFGLKLFGVTKELRPKWKSQIDHAALNETSLMMHYAPDLVDLTALPADRSVWPQGVAGADPRDATAQLGRQCMLDSIDVVRELFETAGV